MKNINAGKMNKRIAIMEYAEAQDSMGQDTQELREKRKVWATVKPIKGGEYYESLKLAPEITYIIYVRFRKDIKPETVILYAGKELEAKYVIDINEEHVMLEIQCAEHPGKGFKYGDVV